jgi:hypothetical protein
MKQVFNNELKKNIGKYLFTCNLLENIKLTLLVKYTQNIQSYSRETSDENFEIYATEITISNSF